jgi:hypothetical protein
LDSPGLPPGNNDGTAPRPSVTLDSERPEISIHEATNFSPSVSSLFKFPFDFFFQTHLYGTLNSSNLNSLEPPRTLGEFRFKTASAGSWSERANDKREVKTPINLMASPSWHLTLIGSSSFSELKSSALSLSSSDPQNSSSESHLVFNSCSCGQLGTPRGCLQHGNTIRRELVRDSSTTPPDEAKRMCIGGAEECEAPTGLHIVRDYPRKRIRTATDCMTHASSALSRCYAWDTQGTPNHHVLVWARTCGSRTRTRVSPRERPHLDSFLNPYKRGTHMACRLKSATMPAIVRHTSGVGGQDKAAAEKHVA